MAEKDSLDQQMEQEEIQQKVAKQNGQKKGGVGKTFLVGTAIAATVFGAAVAEHYTGVVGKVADGAQEIAGQAGEGIVDAYNGTLTWLANQRSAEVKLSAAQELLKGASIETKMVAAADIYQTMPEDKQGEFLSNALSGQYGVISEGLQTAIANDIVNNTKGGALVSLVQKGYTALEEDGKQTVRDGVLEGLTGESRYDFAFNAYAGLEEGQKMGFAAQLYMAATEKQQESFIDRAVSGLPEEKQYSLFKGKLMGMETDEIESLMGSVAYEKFSGDDFVETISGLYNLSRAKHDNGSEIVKAVVSQHANEIGKKIQQYVKDFTN
jgi:hypothetical protein